MSCETIRRELIGFHFGELEATARAEVERHLVTCPACLGEFLSVKRDVELAGEVEERPSSSARSKLRAAVATELGLGPRTKLWWERPLAYGLAAAALVVAMVSVQRIADAEGRTPVEVQRLVQPAP